MGDPLFRHTPQLSETTGFTSWAEAQVLKDWFSLRTGSPAVGTATRPLRRALAARPQAAAQIVIHCQGRPHAGELLFRDLQRRAYPADAGHAINPKQL